MSESYDLIVIGAGMAGVAAANKCATEGWRVAIVDSLPYGGTCALRGCDPKEILRRGAEIIDSARLMRGKGIDDAGLRINWRELMTHKHGFTDPVPPSMEDGLAGNGVDTLHAHASFTGARQIEVDATPYAADRVLIATGARPRPLDFPGHEHLIDSTDFLDLDTRPPRILFVGGGFISFEFAHLAARVGSSTVIVDRGERPLKHFDPDLVELSVSFCGGPPRSPRLSAATADIGSPWSARATRRRSRPILSSTAQAASPTSPDWASIPPASGGGSAGYTSAATSRARRTLLSGPRVILRTPPGCR